MSMYVPSFIRFVQIIKIPLDCTKLKKEFIN